MLTAIALCLVVGITDGDTIKVRCGEPDHYEEIKVRLGGIDAPESAQPFGLRSKQALSDLCYMEYAKITPKSIDRYRRPVVDVECQGKDAGQEQVKDGFAWVYKKYDRGYRHLYSVQDEAMQAKRGLWAQEAIAPWEWRKGARQCRQEGCLRLRAVGLELAYKMIRSTEERAWQPMIEA